MCSATATLTFFERSHVVFLLKCCWTLHSQSFGFQNAIIGRSREDLANFRIKNSRFTRIPQHPQRNGGVEDLHQRSGAAPLAYLDEVETSFWWLSSSNFPVAVGLRLFLFFSFPTLSFFFVCYFVVYFELHLELVFPCCFEVWIGVCFLVRETRIRIHFDITETQGFYKILINKVGKQITVLVMDIVITFINFLFIL